MGLQSGVTFLKKWGYKSRFWWGAIQGGKDITFSKISAFLVSMPPPKCHYIFSFTLLNNAISGCLVFLWCKTGGEEEVRGIEGVMGVLLVVL